MERSARCHVGHRPQEPRHRVKLLIGERSHGGEHPVDERPEKRPAERHRLVGDDQMHPAPVPDVSLAPQVTAVD